MRLPAPLFTIAALLLTQVFPSCVQWNIGKRIRQAGEVHTGVDVFHPVDGKLYRAPSESGYDMAWVRAPEVSYTRRTELVTSETYEQLWGGSLHSTARNIHPSGREHWALVYRDGMKHARGFKSLASPPPPHTPSVPAEQPDRHDVFGKWADDYGSLSHTEAGTARRLAAAPFDYLIDPALSAVSTIALNVPAACALVVASPFILIWPEWFIKK